MTEKTELPVEEKCQDHEQLLARVKEQAREIEQHAEVVRVESSLRASAELELAALKAQPSGVVPDAYELAEKVRVDLDRQACPNA